MKTHILNRPLAALAIALALFPVALRAADRAPEVYGKDLDFLLTTLEQKAGHFFPLKGVDWPAVSRQFHDEVKSVSSDAEHVKLCGRLVARLRDGHAGLQDVQVPLPDEARGRRWTGPRVHLVVVGDKVFVRQAFGSAAQRGIGIGMEVTRIDGVPARPWLSRRVTQLRDHQGYSTDHQALYAACHWGLADWEGTRIEFELLKDSAPRTVAIVRNGGPNFAPIGPVFPPKKVQELGRQSYGRTDGGFGYLHLRDIPETLPAQLDTMLAFVGDAPGVILDLRANGGGGGDHAAMFGRFIGAGKTWHNYASAGARPFDGPLVLIVDAGTRSAGETFGGLFKQEGRAYVIGDGPTAGMSSSKEKVPVPSGLFAAYFSVRSNMGRFNGGRGVEGIGMAPQELVPYDPAELAKGVDTQIRRAEELLRTGLPKTKVPYEAARSQ
jgi:C-terminal processing protease CtpA/Prc